LNLDENDLNIIMTIPFNTPNYKPYAASTLVPCPTCKQQTWIGPKQRAAVTTVPKSVVMCAECAARYTLDNKDELEFVGVKSLMTKEEEKKVRLADGTN
jgi:hypothetical protein